MTNPIRPMVMNVSGRATILTIGPMKPLTSAEDHGQADQADEFALVLDELRQERGQDIERDGGDDRTDDEALQGALRACRGWSTWPMDIVSSEPRRPARAVSARGRPRVGP